MTLANLHLDLRLVMIVLAAFVLTGCGDRTSRAAEAAALARAQFEAGNLIEARSNVQQAIIGRDDVADYFILLGRIELAAEKPTSAFNAFSRALGLQADNLEGLQNIAELGLQTDRIEEADAAADRILLLFPGSTRAMLVKGFVAIETGRLDEAKRFAENIRSINQADIGGAILSARVSAIEGQFEEAIGIVDAARKQVEDTSALDATLLEIYRAQGNPQGMQSVFPEVVAASDQNIAYQLDYINFLYKAGNMAAARARFAEAIASKPNDRDLLRGLARLFHEYDRQPLSTSQLEALGQTGSRAAQLAFARFYLESMQLANAEGVLRQAVKENVLEAKALASRVYLALGRDKEARRAAESVLAVDPRNPDALLARSALERAGGMTDRAIEDANIVVSDAPQEYAGYVALAKAQLAKGGELRARQVFERGMDALPQSALLAGEYGAFLRRIGDPSRLATLYADLVAASPSSIKTAKAYAAVCEETRDAVCRVKAGRALEMAARSYLIDDAPGAPKQRGLFSRITPEQICRAAGGICTVS